MSSPYERWEPSVGDRVRVVMRDETGDAEAAGPTGTIVEIRQRTPYVVCEVEYDAGPDADGGARRQEHAESDLEPLDRVAASASRSSEAASGAAGTTEADWQPTVGDRVVALPGDRAATITAIDERDGGTVCEVEYDHHSGERSEPQRGSHAIGELRPTREPSADALDEAGGHRSTPPREPDPAPI